MHACIVFSLARTVSLPFSGSTNRVGLASQLHIFFGTFSVSESRLRAESPEGETHQSSFRELRDNSSNIAVCRRPRKDDDDGDNGDAIVVVAACA